MGVIPLIKETVGFIKEFFGSNTETSNSGNSLKSGGLGCTNTTIYIENLNYSSSEDIPPD